MDLQPLISVIVPVYNAAEFIPAALESVLAQNYSDYELIVVDDGSTDDLTAVLQPYQSHIHYVRQENAGSAQARNTGLNSARGQFIVFFDADDLMLPGKLRQQAAFLQLHAEIGYVQSGWQQIDEDGRFLQTVQPWQDAPELTLESWLQYKPVQLGAIMFRRIWLDRVGGFDPALRQAHDVDLMLRLNLAGCPGAWLYESTISYRQYAASTMHRHAAKQIESVLALLDKFFAYPDLPAVIKENKNKTYYYTTLWLAWYAYSNGDETAALPLLQQNLALAPQVSGLPVENTVVEWLVHFTAWEREHGRSSTALQTMWPTFQQAAPAVQDWAQFERLLAWWQTDLSDAIRDAYTPFDLWRIFQSGLDWERGNPTLSAEMVLLWWASVWQPYLQHDFDAACAGWADFADLSKEQLLYLLHFGLAAEPNAATTTLLSQLWQDAQAGELPAVQNWNEVSFFADLPDLRRPRVSVVIPVYNGAAHIEATVQSVLAQTFRNFEVIVIDDGSTDGTRERLRPYRGQIRLISQPNRGVSAARNLGLKLALGEYILFLDGDDLLLPDKLAHQAACLDEDRLLGVVHSGWRLVDQFGHAVRDIKPWQYAPDLSLVTWLKWKPVFLGAMLFRRSWLRRIDGFDPALRQAEDTDFLLRLSLAGCPMRWLEEITIDYRQHGGNVTRNVSRQAVDMSRVLDSFFQRADLPASVQELEPEVRHYTNVWLVWQLYRSGAHEEAVAYLRQAREQGLFKPPAILAQSWLIQFAGYAHEEGVILEDLRELFPWMQQTLEIDEAAWPYLETMLSWWLEHWDSLHQGQLGDLGTVQEVIFGALHLEQDGHIRSSVEWVEWWLKVWRYFLPVHDCGAGHEMHAFWDKTAVEIVALSQASILYAPHRLEPWKILVFWYRAQESGLIKPDDKHADTALYLTYFGQSLLGKQWRRAGRGLWRALRSSMHLQIGQSWRAWWNFVGMGIRYWRNGR